MLAQWTGDVVGQMHIAGITARQLAAEIGWHEKYLSAVLNGHRGTKNSENQVRAALSRLIQKQAQESA